MERCAGWQRYGKELLSLGTQAKASSSRCPKWRIINAIAQPKKVRIKMESINTYECYRSSRLSYGYILLGQ